MLKEIEFSYPTKKQQIKTYTNALTDEYKVKMGLKCD